MVGKHPVKLEPVRTKCLKNIRFKPLCIPCAISPTKQVDRQMQDWRHPAFTKVHTNHVIQPASLIQNSNTVIQCKNFHILAKKAPLHSLTINFAELLSALAGWHPLRYHFAGGNNFAGKKLPCGQHVFASSAPVVAAQLVNWRHVCRIQCPSTWICCMKIILEKEPTLLIATSHGLFK